MLKNGFVKIDRSIVDWRWYHDPNTFLVFIHLILTANYEDKQFETITVKRGQRVISYSGLAKELELSVQSVRTAISHLCLTGELTRLSYAKYTVISVKNYDKYQSANTTSNTMSNKLLTSCQQAPNNNERKIRKKKKEKERERGALLPEMRSFGEYRNVQLTDDEYAKLTAKFDEGAVRKYIDKLDYHIESKGRKYAKHYPVLVRWMTEDDASAAKGSADETNTENEVQWQE